MQNFIPPVQELITATVGEVLSFGTYLQVTGERLFACDGAYHPLKDVVAVVDKTDGLHGDIDFVCLHELVHWTGHPERLGRPLIAKVYETRAKSWAPASLIHTEEATAQLGAYKLAVIFGMDKMKAHWWYRNYVQSLTYADFSEAERESDIAVTYLLNLIGRSSGAQFPPALENAA